MHRKRFGKPHTKMITVIISKILKYLLLNGVLVSVVFFFFLIMRMNEFIFYGWNKFEKDNAPKHTLRNQM